MKEEIQCDPRSRIDQLITCGRIRIDKYLGADYYLQTALDSLNVAEFLLKRGSTETPFIIYVKYINFCRIIYKSKYFRKASINEKSRCSSKLTFVKAKKEKLEKLMLEGYAHRDRKVLEHVEEKARDAKSAPVFGKPLNLLNRLKPFTVILPKNVPVMITTISIANSEKTVGVLCATNKSDDFFVVTDMIISYYEDGGEIENFESIGEILSNNKLICIGFIHYQKDSSPFLTCVLEKILRKFENSFSGAVAVMVSYLGSIESFVLTDSSVNAASSNETVKRNNNVKFVKASYVLLDEHYHMNLHDIREYKTKITPSCFVTEK